IPVGTAIQNARSTYLGLQYYVTGNDSEKNHFQQGLQRDNVHLSITTGRYIAGLAFARLLVPEEYLLPEYTLPMIADSELVGALPKEYTLLAQLCVQKMIDSMSLTGDAYCGVTPIEGYTEEPGAKLAKSVTEMSLSTFTAKNQGDLVAQIKAKIDAIAPEGAVITVTPVGTVSLTSAEKQYNVTVKIQYGYMTTTVNKTITAKLGG
ncbi:MAG: hypothetical protein IJY04_04420, partial [Clostridia bacterium]|nr:hypothetical protein [Clostridia bacterium]